MLIHMFINIHLNSSLLTSNLIALIKLLVNFFNIIHCQDIKKNCSIIKYVDKVISATLVEYNIVSVQGILFNC